MTDIQTRPASPFLAAPPPSPNPVSADDGDGVDEKDKQATIGEHYLKAVSPATLEKALAYFASQEAAIVESKDKSSVLPTVDTVPATKNIELLRASLKYNRKIPVSGN